MQRLFCSELCKVGNLERRVVCRGCGDAAAEAAARAVARRQSATHLIPYVCFHSGHDAAQRRPHIDGWSSPQPAALDHLSKYPQFALNARKLCQKSVNALPPRAGPVPPHPWSRRTAPPAPASPSSGRRSETPVHQTKRTVTIDVKF